MSHNNVFIPVDVEDTINSFNVPIKFSMTTTTSTTTRLFRCDEEAHSKNNTNNNSSSSGNNHNSNNNNNSSSHSNDNNNSSSEAVMFAVLLVIQFGLFVASRNFMPSYFTPASVLYLVSACSIIYHLQLLSRDTTGITSLTIWWISHAGYLVSCAMLLCCSLHLVSAYPDVVVDPSIGVPMMFVSLHALLSAGLCTYLVEFLLSSTQKLAR